MKAVTKLWIGLLALVLLSPLGLILPAKLGAGSAWGEWSAEEIRKLVGYLPSGMSRLADLWKAPMPDYAFKGQGSASIGTLSISYILSGVLGVAAVVVVAILLGKALARRGNSNAS
jgi:hypothetical protein